MVTKLNKKIPLKKNYSLKNLNQKYLNQKKVKEVFLDLKKLKNYSFFQFLKLGIRCSILVVSLATNITSPEIDILSEFVLIWSVLCGVLDGKITISSSLTSKAILVAVEKEFP